MARFSYNQRYFDSNGDPLSGGKLYFYEPSTTTPKTTYSDAAQTVANANPLILDADGIMSDVFYSGSVKLVISDSNDVQQNVIDPVGGDTLTSAEVKVLYEDNADTNALTDANLSKLNGIESGADVTSESNVTAALDGATLTNVTPTTSDKFLHQDASNSDELVYSTGSQLAALVGTNWTSKSANYTAVLGDAIVTTTGGITITLPASFSQGDKPVIVQAGVGHSVDIAPDTGDAIYIGSESIGTSVTYTLGPGQAVMLIPNGTASWSLLPLSEAEVKGLDVDTSVSTSLSFQIGQKTCAYAGISANSASIDFLDTLYTPGDGNYAISGYVWVQMNGAYSGLTVNSPSGVTASHIRGTAPSSSGDSSILRWEYVSRGTNKYFAAEWT